MKQLTSIILCIFFVWNLDGQVNKNGAFAQKEGDLSIGAVYDLESNRILLRWAPDNENQLKHIQENGVAILKVWSENGNQQYFSDTVKLKSDSEWLASSISNHGFKTARELRSKDLSTVTFQSILEKYALVKNLFHFTLFTADISIEASHFLGLAYIDTFVKPDISYTYFIQFIHFDAPKNKFKIQINSSNQYIFPMIDSVKIQGLNRLSKISWNYKDLEDNYVAYIIEKSTLPNSNFEAISEAPFVAFSNYALEENSSIIEFRDSLAQNNVPYYYRVKGINYFGQESPYSKVVKVIGQDPSIAAQPSITSILEFDKPEFNIRWYFNPDFESKIKGFYVQRSTDNRKTYQTISPLLDANIRYFLDESPININFYKIIAIDKSNNEISSIPAVGQLNDNTPPAAPQNLEGYIDTLGNVYLNWDENTEADLQGYHVFYCNVRNGEYSIISNEAPAYKAEFLDSIYLNTLAKKIYYKVLAIDYRGNQSRFSNVLELDRPDMYPPVPAVFKKKNQQIDQVFFTWTNSSSEDVVSNILQRKSINTDWQELTKNEEIGTTVSYIDSTITCSELYQYRILSTDISNFISISDTITLKCIDSGKRKEIKDISVEKNDAFYEISWDYQTSIPVKSILIYRSENKGDLKLIKQYWKEDIARMPGYLYKDKEISSKSTYSYMVVMRFDDNGFTKSKPTKPL